VKKLLLAASALALAVAAISTAHAAPVTQAQITDAMLGDWCPVKYNPYDIVGAYVHCTNARISVTRTGFHLREGEDCKFTHFLRSPGLIVNVDVLCSSEDIELRLSFYTADDKLVIGQDH
jgi:hypothetical protein